MYYSKTSKRFGFDTINKNMSELTNKYEEKTYKPNFKRSTKPRKTDKEFEEARNLKRGLKKFYFGKKYVWALNQKSAEKKAKKQNII